MDRLTGLQPHFEELFAKSHVIWDWNGTLLDDVDLCVRAIGGILDRHGLPRVSRDGYREAFGFPVENYYRQLGFDFERAPFREVSDAFMAEYRRGLGACRVFEGMPELIDALRARGVGQSVLSAAYEEHLHAQLSHFGMDGRFDRVYGLADTYAVGKVERGRELIAASGFAPRDTVLIGDTDHDLEVGHALGVDVLLVADGHQSYERLASRGSRVARSRYGASDERS